MVTDENGLTIEDNGANLTEILDAWAVFDNPRYVELPLYRDHIIKLQNTGKQTVSGIDLAFDHIIMLDHGNVKFAVDATHYLQFDRNKPGSNQVEELIGTWRYPENIASAKVSWSGDAFYASLTAEYTSSYEDDISGLRGREIDELLGLGVLDSNDERDVESWLTVRANIGYDFDKLNINLSINNLLNEDAPVAYGSSRGFDSLNHNALGTTYRLSLSYKF